MGDHENDQLRTQVSIYSMKHSELNSVYDLNMYRMVRTSF